MSAGREVSYLVNTSSPGFSDLLMVDDVERDAVLKAVSVLVTECARIKLRPLENEKLTKS